MEQCLEHSPRDYRLLIPSLANPGSPEGESSPQNKGKALSNGNPPPTSDQNAAPAHLPAAAGVATRHPSLALPHLSPRPGGAPLGSPVSWREGGVLKRVTAPLFSLLWDRNTPGVWIDPLGRGQSEEPTMGPERICMLQWGTEVLGTFLVYFTDTQQEHISENMHIASLYVGYHTCT